MLEVNDLVGIPFENGGRTLRGFDCWGLVMEVYRRRGIKLKDYPIDAMSTARIAQELKLNEGNWIKVETPEEGDLVVMHLCCAQWANHVGVYIGNGRFVHAYAGGGVCIERIARWKGRIAGFYRPGWIA